MGWDAFGLPAENAARDRGLDPDRWTQSNIATMKEHMENLNFSFDWNREFATCDSDYYKWTQFLFIKMFENDLVYRREALVNWDPVDNTVLADEQVDASGRSWRSGAKVEKRKLRQWFIKTTRFSKALYDGLDDPELKDWKDIIKLQKHWIGDCCGTTIDFEVVSDDPEFSGEMLSVWMKYPEFIDQAQFVGVKPKSNWDTQSNLRVKNPFTIDTLPVYVTADLPYPEGSDTYLGIPDVFEADKEFAMKMNIPDDILKPVMTEEEQKEYRRKVCAEAKRRGIGGYPTSSKLRDWLISRQRYWGTPIPIVHCEKCGPQTVPEEKLPVKLPVIKKIVPGKNPLIEAKAWLNTNCPKCGGEALRETDTMDTFVDSSWYYLRFLDPDNVKIPFSVEKSKKFMPVDVYVGGKEHAVLHLYYARFFGHFLHSAGLLPSREPFKRLLVQGMVKGRTYKNKTSGEYLKEDMIEWKDKKTAVVKDTKDPVVVGWEKMSKSKLNGVDPLDMFNEFGVDTTRLIILGDVAPTSSRNWSRDTFQGVINWQHRLWITLQNYIRIRKENLKIEEKTEQFLKEEEFLWDSRNFYVKLVTFNFVESYQLSVAISKMQGLTNSLRKSSKEVIALSEEYEKALAAQIVMLSAVAPHFAAELWAGFLSAPNRISNLIIWNKPINQQPWPKVDHNYCLTMNVIVNRDLAAEIKIPKFEFERLTHNAALRLAKADEKVAAKLGKYDVFKTVFKVNKDCSANLNFSIDVKDSKKSSDSESVDDRPEEIVNNKKNLKQ